MVTENGTTGTEIVAEPDADVTAGTYVVESDGATSLTAGQDITLSFQDSGSSSATPTAGTASVTVYYGWV